MGRDYKIDIVTKLGVLEKKFLELKRQEENIKSRVKNCQEEIDRNKNLLETGFYVEE